MVVTTDPCEDSLSKACFKERPEHAKQVLAYRVLGMLLGLEYRKRLQTFKGLPLPVGLDSEMGGSLNLSALSGAFSALSPVLVSVWEGGPPHLIQSIEGDLVMPTIRRAKVDFAGAENSEIIAAVPGVQVCVVSMGFTVGGETNITLNSDTTAMSGPMDFGGTDEPRGLTHYFGDCPLKTVVGEGFFIDSSLAVQVSGFVTYYLI